MDNHVAAVALYVAHYNLCRVHEALKTTPAKVLGVVDRTWGELIDAALATQPITPVPTAPERRKLFTVIKGGKGVSQIDSPKTLAESMILLVSRAETE